LPGAVAINVFEVGKFSTQLSASSVSYFRFVKVKLVYRSLWSLERNFKDFPRDFPWQSAERAFSNDPRQSNKLTWGHRRKGNCTLTEGGNAIVQSSLSFRTVEASEKVCSLLGIFD
jgi:hypothetical protein